MNWGAVLAWTQCVLGFGAAVGYGLRGDVRHALYWIFASFIVAVITY